MSFRENFQLETEEEKKTSPAREGRKTTLNNDDERKKKDKEDDEGLTQKRECVYGSIFVSFVIGRGAFYSIQQSRGENFFGV